jgi:hypothetical protein
MNNMKLRMFEMKIEDILSQAGRLIEMISDLLEAVDEERKNNMIAPSFNIDDLF